MMVGVSKWKYSQATIDDRQKACDYYGDPSEECKNEAWFMRELSWQLAEKFGVTRNFTFAFMDSFSQSGPELSDEVQQQHWWEETLKLWEEATGRNETFDFKTIDDVLEENVVCREENQRLHDIIDEDIENLRQDVEHNGELISSLASTLTINTKHIDDNSDEISRVSETLTASVNSLNEDVKVTNEDLSATKNRVNENKDAIDGIEIEGKL